MIVFFKCRFCKEEMSSETVIEEIKCPTCKNQYTGSKALINYMKMRLN